MMGFDEHQVRVERHQQQVANGLKYATMEAYRLEQEKAFNGKLGDEEAEGRGVVARFRRGLSRLLRRR